MIVGKRGLELIKEFEGFRKKAYQDTGGVWTIGWGTTRIHDRPVKETDTCTKEEATIWLELDVARFEDMVNKNVKVPLNQNQFDAMVSIVYNVGPGMKNGKSGIITLGNGAPSTLLRKLNSGDYQGAADQFLVWYRTKGSEAGLLRRRKAERELFLEPVS